MKVPVTPIGTVSELWRYPVKSMLGERCEALRMEARGVEGDRLFAVRDSKEKFGSGKSTRRFRKIEGLFRLQASYHHQVPHIRLPSGHVVAGDSPAVHQMLSEELGLPVVLAREEAISHLDAGPVHLITSASLAWLSSALPSVSIDARRFRPNLVIDVPGADLVEQAWLGKRLCVGKEVELEVCAATERCGMVASTQSDLPEEPSILRHIARQADLKFGVYARVVVPGTVHFHDSVVLGNGETRDLPPRC
ncbi:putative Fe-S protein [Alloalcanivorax dieselolei B5]|uniref:Putative Fe-S protein n=1 Tax=Alcanivorax dieselolei (strain DSM 16502 / CGMCC 1.3690 / MCCC 1A00001 / B-5) TaxID=930169 RepID=K0CLD0_ALCDB|nr:MOSC domain-containing protein [Alloalcanivorax dieselolei]AFT72597.1 putative Fe-S protein [Alloalcanivorax dieselolei B5]